MEGISGICRKSQVLPDGAHYREGRTYMTADVNACVEGCLQGGATRIIVRDVHGSGSNLLWDSLHPGAEYIMGVSQQGRMPGLADCDGLILLGYHAMAGTPFGVLEHTINSTSWQNFWLNGTKAGEIAIDAALAGEKKIPVIMVSGDDKTATEAKSFLPDVITAEVKCGIGIESAILLPPEKAHALIRERATEAVQRCEKMRYFRVRTPVTLRLQHVVRGKIPRHRREVREIDGQTYELSASTMQEAFLLLIEG